jgi:hypothetical protein
MNAHNPAAEKVQVTERPMAAPAKCVVCGAVDRPVVDFGMSLDFYGAILFCVDCMGSIAYAIGYAPVAAVELREKDAQAIFDNQDAVVQMLNEKAAEINDITAGLSRSIDDILRAGPVGSEQSEQEELPNVLRRDDTVSEWTEPATESVFESAQQ